MAFCRHGNDERMNAPPRLPATVTAPVGAPRRRGALAGVLDQAFSSISNGFIVFAVAVVASPQSFGQITLIMTSLMAVLSCFRGGFGIPLLLKADQTLLQVRREGSFALAAALVVGPVVSIVILLMAPRLDSAAIALAVSAPFVLAQDTLRYVAITAGRPFVAALWDGIWCLGTLLVLVCSWLGLSVINAGLVLALWGLLAFVAFVAMLIDLRLQPSIRGLLGRYRPDWHHRLRYAADAGLEQIGLLLVFAITSTMVNPDATGALRGAIALLAPLLIAASAVQLVMIPESVRSSSPPIRVWRSICRVMGVLALMAVFAGGVYSMLPERVGFLLLGESFTSAQRVIPYMTAQFIAAAVTFAVLVYLRTFNRSADVLRLKLFYLVAITATAVVTAHWVGSAVGVSIGLAVASALVAAIAFVSMSPRGGQPVPAVGPSESRGEIITAAGDFTDEVAPAMVSVSLNRAAAPIVSGAESRSVGVSEDATDSVAGRDSSRWTSLPNLQRGRLLLFGGVAAVACLVIWRLASRPLAGQH